jgi:hypothetical protein
MDGDDVTALRLVQERGRIIAGLAGHPKAHRLDEGSLSAARDLGRQALEHARQQSIAVRSQIESLERGRTGLSAYNPGLSPQGDSLDVSR